MADGIRWGIMATGWIAEMMTADLKIDGHEVTAVGSRSAAKAEAFAQRFGIPRHHASYQALVEDPAVDIVYIGTPHPHHAAGALQALQAGKHVLIEKPLTINAGEARQIQQAAAQRGLFAMEAMWTRFLPHMVRLRELVRTGALGDIMAVTADHTQSLPADPAHRINAMDLGGGALLDLGVYPISFSFDLLGRPLTVKADAVFKETGADSQIATVFGYGGRAPRAYSFSASDGQGPNHAAVIGSKARVEVARVWYTPTTFELLDNDNNLIERFDQPVPGRGMQFQAREAERAIAAGQTTSPLMPISQSVEIMEVLDAIRAQIGLRYPSES
jgi:predicted dehydrogenase